MADFDAKLTLTGAKELERALLEIGAVPAGRAGQTAVRAGARVLARKERENIRARGLVLSGKMLGSIKVTDDPDKPAGSRTAFAGTTLFYAKFSELGTVHEAAKPWLRPAVDEGAQEALDKLIEALDIAIAREVNRLNQKYKPKAE